MLLPADKKITKSYIFAYLYYKNLFIHFANAF